MLVARGMLQDDAAVVADTLVWADLRGVSSHGVGWLARFFELIEEGPIALQARPQLLADKSADSKLRFVLDAKQAAGAVAMMQAAQLAVEIEAAAMGMPTVGSDIYGLADAVVNEETGLLVPPRDAEALAVAISRLLENKPLRIRMGESARRRAWALFDSKNINLLMAEAYDSLLHQKT